MALTAPQPGVMFSRAVEPLGGVFLSLLVPSPKPYQVEDFRADLHSLCGGFAVEPLASRPVLSASLNARSFAGLDVAFIGLDVDHVRRSSAAIRKEPGEHFFLILQNQGHSWMAQDGPEHGLAPGDMFLVDSTKPSLFRYDGSYSSHVSLHLPRDEMKQRFGHRIHGGIQVPRDDPMGLAMRSVLVKLFGSAGRNNSHITEAFFSLFGCILTERAASAGVRVHPNQQIVGNALAIIAYRYSDPEFRVSDIAEALGIPVRQLQLAFQAIGNSAHERIQAVRLKNAYARIVEPSTAVNDATVASIAFECGFRDLSTFYRQFHKQHGFAPGAQLRKNLRLLQ